MVMDDARPGAKAGCRGRAVMPSPVAMAEPRKRQPLGASSQGVQGWFSKRAKAKKIAELTSLEIMEKVKEKARREGLDSARPSFRKLKGQAQSIVNGLRAENSLLKTQNASLLIETSKPQDYELVLDIAETSMRDLIDLRHEKAMDSGRPEAFRSLSETCEQAEIVGKKTDRDGLIDHVKDVVSDVRERAREMFRRFFGWTKPEGEVPKPPPAPANASPQATPLAPVKRGPAPF